MSPEHSKPQIDRSLESIVYECRSRFPNQEPGFRHFSLNDFNPLSGNFKRRELWDPNDAMRAIHEQFLEQLYGLGTNMPYATGGIRGGSPVANLRPHADNRYFYMLDLEDAYSQVDMFSLAHWLVGAGLKDDVRDIERFLRSYCQTPDKSGLCTGAPASPVLFNFACLELDRQLGSVADLFGFTYTRYLDDLTFSSPDRGGQPSLDMVTRPKRRVIREVIQGSGLVIQDNKTRIQDLHAAPIVVTGLQLNRSGKWQLPTQYLEIIDQELDKIDALAQEGPLAQYFVDKLAGYRGLLVASWDTRRQQPTEAETALVIKYKMIVRKHKQARRRSVL